MAPRRLALFIDYQNVYMRCRESFRLNGDDATGGQIDPLKVGRLVATLERDTRLERVFVYRGEPNARKHAYANAACRRQVSSLANVEVHTRPLQYIDG